MLGVSEGEVKGDLQDQGLFLRSAQSVAAPNQREYQWPRAAVHAKRRRSEPVLTPRLADKVADGALKPRGGFSLHEPSH